MPLSGTVTIGGADVDEHSTENMQHCPVEPNISWEDWIRNVCQDYINQWDDKGGSPHQQDLKTW